MPFCEPGASVLVQQIPAQQKTFSFDNLSRLYHATEPVTLRNDDRYVIFADLHLGDGGKADDFLVNADLFDRVLREYYLDEHYSLILNGDVEELQRFPLNAIHARWSEIYWTFLRFENVGRFHKLVGNHDISLVDTPGGGFPVAEAMRFCFNGDNIFIFHGHQVSRWYMRHNRFAGLTLKHIATPLGIKNYEVSHSSRKRFATERMVYDFAARTRVLSIIGHTHRPLFESMSKIDSVKFELERLCRAYPSASPDERSRIEAQITHTRRELLEFQQKHPLDRGTSSLYNEHLAVPCLFNSGCVIGKSGVTALEIADGEIRLVYWFDRNRSTRYLEDLNVTPQQLGQTDIYRVIVQGDRLDYVLSRIRLLT